jgi:hypothetical protein
MNRKSKLLMVAIPLMIILLGATVYQYAYLRVRDELIDRENTIAVETGLLAKQMGLIADKPLIEKRLAALQDIRKAENLKMIEGQTPSVAAAALQGMVKGMITSRGGNISSERVEKPEDSGKFKIITVTLDTLLPDTRALADTLYAIETQTPYLVIREMDVSIRNFREPRDLSVKLKVSGLTGGR